MARSKDKVIVGYVHPADVSSSFHHSLIGLLLHDRGGSQRIAGLFPRNSSANISNARNGIVQRFLTDTDADWLWMVDADMAFPPDIVDRLLDSAHDKTAPVVGGLCFGVHEDTLFSTLYFFEQDDDGTVATRRFDTFPPEGKFQVHATGAACLLIHRSVLEAVLELDGIDPAYPWFQETSLSGKPCGEDVTFCIRVGRAGFPIFVDCGIRLGHQKPGVLTYEKYLAQREAHRG